MSYSTEDEYGFKRDSGFNAELYNNYITILTRRSIKWQKYIERNDANVMSRKLKRYIRKGIPCKIEYFHMNHCNLMKFPIRSITT